jgi:hypothetical protein
MLEERAWQGLWHDVREPDTTVAGDLTFSREDSQLALIGRLARLSGDAEAPWALVERPRICGVTTDGNWITLESCIPRSARVGTGVPVESHSAGVVLVGAHWAANEEIVFDAIEFQFTHLDRWATVSGFSTSLNFKNDKKTLESLGVTFTPPASIEASLNDGTRLSVDFGFTSTMFEQVTTESIIRQHATIALRFPAPTRFSEAVEIGGQIRNFLNLGVGASVHPQKIVGVVDPPAAAEVDKFTGLPPTQLRIEILYQLSDQPEPRDLAEKRDPYKMTFTLAEIANDLGVRFDNWRVNYKRLRPTFDLFFAVNYGALRYIDPQFLALAQAAETYDRRTHAKLFPSWSSASDRKRGEPSLRLRLERLYERMRPVSTHIAPNRDEFVSAVVDGRNYYTHYDARLEQRAPRGIQLVPLTAKLKALIEGLLLGEIGFATPDIDAMFERIERYQLIRHLESVVTERDNSTAP